MNPVQNLSGTEAGNYYEWIYHYNCNKKLICYELFEFRDYETKPRRAMQQEMVCWNLTFSSRDLVLLNLSSRQCSAETEKLLSFILKYKLDSRYMNFKDLMFSFSQQHTYKPTYHIGI